MRYELVIWIDGRWTCDGYGEPCCSDDPNEINEAVEALRQVAEFADARLAIVDGDSQTVTEYPTPAV